MENVIDMERMRRLREGRFVYKMTPNGIHCKCFMDTGLVSGVSLPFRIDMVKDENGMYMFDDTRKKRILDEGYTVDWDGIDVLVRLNYPSVLASLKRFPTFIE